MLAAYASSLSLEDPLSALTIGDIAEPGVPADWLSVNTRACSLNHHDVWALKGVALRPEQVPMILGTDAAGVTDDGREVIVYAVIGEAVNGDETIDPGRTLLSEKYPGTLAEKVRVPARNLIDKPAGITFEEAACLPTAYLTAYRMLATKSGTKPGDTVLVQGAGGGVSTAAIVLGKAMGLTVWVTSRDAAKREWALTIGADAAFEPGAKLPGKADAVIETVGAATWEHSVKSLRPGGTIVISGATSGYMPPAQLTRIFFLQLTVAGSTMGTRAEFEAMLDLLVRTGARPVIDRVMPLADGRAAFAAMAAGDVHGKLVLTV
jgi:NADPH:quinone reductase-like Zn-dependent oxidoreductase